MSEHDFKLNVDSLIERLLEGKFCTIRKFICNLQVIGLERNGDSLQYALNSNNMKIDSASNVCNKSNN